MGSGARMNGSRSKEADDDRIVSEGLQLREMMVSDNLYRYFGMARQVRQQTLLHHEEGDVATIF